MKSKFLVVALTLTLLLLSLMPVGQAARAADKCETFRENCVGVANNAEAMCYAAGGSQQQCLDDWFRSYYTCMAATGCSPFPD